MISTNKLERPCAQNTSTRWTLVQFIVLDFIFRHHALRAPDYTLKRKKQVNMSNDGLWTRDSLCHNIVGLKTP
jgi:hypothetical protein